MVLNEKFKILSAGEIARSAFNIKREWKLKNPFEKYCYMYSLGKLMSSFLRLPLFLEDPTHVHLFAYFAFSYIVTEIVLSIYTICYYVMNGNFLMALPCTCMLGIIVGVCKFIKKLWLKKDLIPIMNVKSKTCIQTFCCNCLMSIQRRLP